MIGATSRNSVTLVRIAQIVQATASGPTTATVMNQIIQVYVNMAQMWTTVRAYPEISESRVSLPSSQSEETLEMAVGAAANGEGAGRGEGAGHGEGVAASERVGLPAAVLRAETLTCTTTINLATVSKSANHAWPHALLLPC